MTKPEKLLEFYRDLITTSQYRVDAKHHVILPIGEDIHPAVVAGKQLVLPAPEYLRSPDTEKQVFFHPLCEQITRRESEVFLFLKRSIMVKLITSMTQLGAQLLNLQTDVSAQRRMSIDQLEILKLIPESDKKSIENWNKLMMLSLKEDRDRMDRWALNVFIRRNGQHDGKSYRRVAVVNFPLFERLASGEIFTHTSGGEEKNLYRTKDYTMFRQVAKAIFPEIDDVTNGRYNVGYDDTVGPYTIAFMRAVLKLANRINEVIDLLSGPFEEVTPGISSLMKISTAWEHLVSPEGQEELSDLARTVPLLQHNAGATLDGSDVPETPAVNPSSRAPGGFKIQEMPVVARKDPEPVRREEPKAPEASSGSINFDTSGMTQEQIQERLEVQRRREEYLKKQREDEQYERERRERRDAYERERQELEDRHRRERDDRPRDYDRRDSYGRDDRDDRDDRPSAPAASDGKITMADIDKRTDAFRNTRAYEEEQESRRDGGRRSRYRDDRDDRYNDRDRYYDDRGSRYDRYRDDRDYDRYDRGSRDYDRGSRRSYNRDYR